MTQHQGGVDHRPESYYHIFRHDAELPAEREILSDVLTEDSRVLDVGTGATGRTAKLMRSFGVASVASVDVNQAAITEFGESEDREAILLCAGDLARLPFSDASFDVVLAAFHAMDYILDPLVRSQALREVSRVLSPGGTFIVNGWNRPGILFSHHGLKSMSSLAVRARYLGRGDVFRRTLTDPNGLRLHQSATWSSRREVESETPLRLSYMIDSFGKSRNSIRVTLTSMEPYLVFRLPNTQR